MCKFHVYPRYACDIFSMYFLAFRDPARMRLSGIQDYESPSELKDRQLDDEGR